MSCKALKLIIIGIGAGNPEHLTVQAIKALNRADVFFIPDKGDEKAALRQLRTEICERFIEGDAYRFVQVPMPERERNPADYRSTVAAWHAEIAAAYERLLTSELTDGACGALLVWGDPSLYDSTIRIIEQIRAKGVAIDYDVIPGISSVQALAAQHRIPLNRIGEPVLITTGRRLADGFPDGVGSVVVMLDGDQSFRRVDQDLDIYWGAYLGMADEMLISGRLADVRDEIETRREQARRKNGWIMDSYLLRRRDS
jgi:precorrin-6A synthase